MRYVWKIHYESADGSQVDDAIAFGEDGANRLDKRLREKGYRVDPRPIKVALRDFSISELEASLKIIGNAVFAWDKDDPGGVVVEANECRQLGRDLFMEHDERLRRIHEDQVRHRG